MDDSKNIIELSSSISINGETITELTMREPTVGDYLASSKVKGGDVEQEIWLFSTLCDVSDAHIKALTMRDYKKIQTKFTFFTQD